MSRVILVVDDEQEVLQLIENLLKNKGFGVVSANSADQALRAFQELPHRPDLVLTDVVMPGVSGPMLADRLLELAPDLPILFMSGYDDRQVVRRYVVEKGYQLIAKPFNLKVLQTAIETALDGAKKD